MSTVSSASSAPAVKASVRGLACPARVKTVRPWSTSVWRSSSWTPRVKARSRRERRSWSLPSETFGTASRGAMLGPSDEEVAVADDRLAVDLDRRLEDDAVEVHGDLHGAADRSRSAEGDMAGAEDLLVLEDVAGEDRLFVGADPELGDVGPVLAVGGQQLHQLPPLLPGRLDQVPLTDGQRDRRVEQPDRGDRAVDDERSLRRALDRGDEALAAGEVSEGAPVAEFAGVDGPFAALEPEPEVAAVTAGDARLDAAVQRGDHGPAAAADFGQVAGHQPAQHLFGDAREAADPDPGLARGLAGGGVGERLDRRREDDVGRGHRGRHRPRRLSRGGIPLGDHSQGGVGAVALGL